MKKIITASVIILILVSGSIYWFIQHEQLKKGCNKLVIHTITTSLLLNSKDIYTSCIRAGGVDEFLEIVEEIAESKNNN
jgi:hypothetical protein